MSAAHTPTPWSQSDADDMEIVAEVGAAICTVMTAYDFPCLDDADIPAVERECEANARFIVRAVNCHDDLLAALEETWRVLRAAGVLHLASGVQLGQTSWYVKISDAQRLSDAAIAKALGRTPNAEDGQ